MKKIAVIISYITMFVQFAVVFCVTPYLLHRLGQSEYGLYQLVSSTASYLSLLGFGFSASYIRYYSRFKAKNSDASIVSLNGMFMSLFIILSAACLALGVVLCVNIELVLGSKLTPEQYASAKKMMFMLALNMALTFPKSIFVCNTTASEKFVFQKSVVLVMDLITPILQILFVIYMSNALSLTCATFIVTLLDLIVNIIYNLAYLKMRFSFRNFDWMLFKEIAGFTFFIFLNQILDLLSSTNIDNYLIGRIEGTDDVAIYSMGSKISQMFHSVAAPISVVFVPTIYRIVESTNDKRALSDIFTKVGKLQFSILYLILSGFFIWGKSFISIWIGEGYEESYYIAIVLMTSLIVALSQNIGIEIQRAKNKHKVRSVVYLLIDIANVFISIPLIIWLGPIGASVGTALAMLFGTILFMNLYYKYAIGLNIRNYWINVIRIMAYSLPCVLGAEAFKRLSGNSGLFMMMMQIGLYSLAYLIIMYFFILDEKEKETINNMKQRRRKRE